MQKPIYRLDYTKQAKDVYKHASRCYNFRKGRSREGFLMYGWSMLFKRKMSEIDIQNLTDFIKRHDFAEEKKQKGLKLSFQENNFIKTRYIGGDGYIYMNKMITSSKEPINDPHIQAQLKLAKEKRAKMAEYYERMMLKEMAVNAYVNNKIRYEDWKWK